MSEPQKEDLTIYRGDDFVLPLQFGYEDPTTSAFVATDLTGQPIIAQIRKTTAYNSALIAQFDIDRTDEANGSITFSVPGEVMQELAGGEYKYDIQIHKTTQVYGTIKLVEDVSHA